MCLSIPLTLSDEIYNLFDVHLNLPFETLRLMWKNHDRKDESKGKSLKTLP